jgi:NADH dehydrogenase
MSNDTLGKPADSPTPAISLQVDPHAANRPRPRVVVIGGGFGGLEAVKHLRNEEIDIILLDRSNHHLFQPLLYQVATAGLAPANIARPLREIFRTQRNVEVVLSEAKRIDVEKRQVITEDLVIPYDYLIVATGSRHSYFGHDEWEKFAPGLKTLTDAVELRRRLLIAFEVAEKAVDITERASALTFVVIGGGPTGVEMAGAISEIARLTMTRDFRRIDPTTAKILLIEGSPRILGGFAEDLSASAQKQLEEIGVEVHTGMVVTNVTAEGIEVKGGRFIPARTVIWAAGNAASPLGKTLGAPTDRAGRVVVNEDLTIMDRQEVQVIGDMANFSYQDGKPLPGVSPTAMQQGRHAANNIREMLAGGVPINFRYWDKGSMATIGRNRAVADLHFVRFGGFLAWMAWAVIHVAFLVGFRNRIAVLSEWLYNYVTFYRGSRLITGTQTGQEALRKPAPGAGPADATAGGTPP